MASTTIDRLIVNSPYEEPERYWKYDRETRLFDLIEGERRPAGYVRASEKSRSFDDPGEFIELPLVNRIRGRVNQWREADYPGVTGTTKRLLEHWHDPEQRDESKQFFFCGLEAIETLIWLAEAPPAERQGIEVPGDGGEFSRLCSKMATGSGKTIVMAMLIAWQVLNKVASPQDARFSKNILVVAPGLTVKSRLQVLFPHGPGNYYDEFSVVPSGLRDRLRQAKVLVRNWHTLMPLDPNDGPKVVKKGPESDEAFTKRVLDEMANAKNIVVINDEAHHAWRVAPKSTVKGVSKADIEEATLWVGGLDRIHRTRNILTCFDLSATPFAPTGKQSGEATLFEWIVSDFNLNDAIESGLVKTPRVVIRDDGKFSSKYKSRLYHIYRDPEVQSDLNRRAKPEDPLPDLVTNGYYLLGRDWLETAERWEAANASTPPVMITVGNRIETSARVHHAFAKGNIQVKGLGDPARMLRIDANVLKKAEEREEAATLETPTVTEEVEEDNGAAPKKLSAQEQAELLRRTVDTVGRPGEPGEKVQNVISVGMLSEGWDAKTVTHIMGLRAFSSQLLCEQVVGRGLRRTSYEVDPETGLFEPEYVNIFGVPFTFLPHEGGDGPPPPPPSPKTRIEVVPDRPEHEIKWPNILRVDHEYRPRLELDLGKVEPLELNAKDTPMLAQLAPIVAGKPNIEQIREIDLLELARENRTQRIAFQTARNVFDQMQPSWKGNREFLLAQLIRLVEKFMRSDRVRIIPEAFGKDDLRRRLILSLNMNKVVQHIWEAVRFENSTALVPVFDTEKPIRSTADMPTWFTSKASHHTEKSQINQCVYDSTWEASEAFDLDRSKHVTAWAKNDHLGFEILYVFKGVVKKYRPDFLILLETGEILVLEVKGQETQQNRTKRKALDEWTKAVNSHGGFGRWSWAVSFDPGDLTDILAGAYSSKESKGSHADHA